MKSVPKRLFLGASFLALSACSFVNLSPGGDKVRLLRLDEVGRCTHLGRVTSNTKATVGFIARNRDTVQEEVNRLARNNAADMGGDSIVPLGPMIEGEQGFNVYRCINP
ncbi:MAG TPA: DUF4156 domain-containing protein [Methylococcaceae bacterium]|nr:DUF4156 domain-containing protein [Methylococcaceae bacterium]